VRLRARGGSDVVRVDQRAVAERVTGDPGWRAQRAPRAWRALPVGMVGLAVDLGR
jgi:hypothetical protein